MELAVAELLASTALAELKASAAGESAVVVDDPLRGAALSVAPVLLEAFLRAVEEDNCVGRHTLLVYRHARRLRTVRVMHRPRMRCIGDVAVKPGEKCPGDKRACGKNK